MQVIIYKYTQTNTKAIYKTLATKLTFLTKNVNTFCSIPKRKVQVIEIAILPNKTQTIHKSLRVYRKH